MPDKKYLIDFPDAPDGSAVWEADKWERNKDAFMSEYKDSDVNVFELEDYNPEDVKEHDQIMISFDDNPEGSAVWDSAKWERNKDAFMAENPTAKIQRVRYKDYWGERATANREQRALLAQPDEERNARLADLGYYDDLTGEAFDYTQSEEGIPQWGPSLGLQPLSSIVGENEDGTTSYADPKVAEFFAKDTSYTDRMAEIARLDAEYDSNPAVIAQREWEAEWRAKQARYIDEQLAGIRDAVAAEVDTIEAGKGAFYQTASTQGMGDAAIIQQAMDFMKGKDAGKALVENEKMETYDTAAKLFAKAKQANEIAGKGFWAATGDVAKDKLRDLATQSDIEAYNQIGEILSRLEAKIGTLDEKELTDEVIESNLSKEEQALIKGFFAYNEAMANAGQNMSKAYKGGKIFGESISFMLEFLATGGLAGGTGKAAGNFVGKGLVRWASKAAKGTAKRAFRTGVTKSVMGLTSALVGTAARTFAAPGTYNRAAEESVKIEDGHLHRGKNVFKSFVDSYIENLSEVSGGLIGKTLGKFGVAPSQWIGKVSFGKIGKMLADNHFAQAMAKGTKALFGEQGVLKKFGFNGIFEEVEEEYIGNLIREYTIQDGALAEMHKDDNFGAMLIGFAPMTLFGAGVSAVKMGAVNIEAANLGKKLRETLGYHYKPEQIDHMMNLVQNAENAKEVLEAIKPLAAGLNAEEFQQLYQYGAFMAQNKAMLFAKKAQDDNLAQAKREEFQQQYGNFWQTSQEGAESVQIAELRDGRTVFVTSAPNESGMVTIIDAETGKQGFTNVSEYAEQTDQEGNTTPATRSWAMDAFLESRIAAERHTAQEARMARERDAQIQNLQSQIIRGTKINLGTTGNPIWMVATGQTSKDGVSAIDSTGVTHTIGWNQVADAMNQPIRVKTDQEIIDEEVAAVVARNAERRRQMSNATPAMTEAVDESAAQSAEVVAQENRHIPMNEDGTVNEIAFWEQDPEGYAAWNDEQNQDGGADTRQQIANSKAILAQMLTEAVAQQQTSNPVVRKQAKKNAEEIQAQIDKLTALEAKYEEQRIAPFRERAMKWKGLTNAPVHIIETEEELAKISSDAANASGRGARVRGMAKDGKAYIYLPGIVEASEIDAVFMHEAVAHTGLKGMLGQQAFDELCDQVWEMMSPEARQVFIGYPGVNGNKRAAADEYIAHVAERMGAGVATAEEKTIWQKIVDFVRNVLRAMGVDINLSESELADLLHMAYKDLAKNMAEAEKIAAQNEAAAKARMNAPTAAQQKYDEYITKGLTAEEIKAGAQNEFNAAQQAYNDLQAQAPKVEMGESVEDFIARKKAYNDKLAKAKALLDEKQTMMDEIARREKPAEEAPTPVVEETEEATPSDERLSIVSLAESVGLKFGKVGNATVFRDTKGDIVENVTPEMVRDSRLGDMIKSSVGNGFIKAEDAEKQYKFFSDLFTMMQNIQDVDLVWATSGAIGFQPIKDTDLDENGMYVPKRADEQQKFAAITGNSDKQYAKTIDFTTICLKTQAVIDVMSKSMVQLGRGLTREEIIDVVYNETHKAGEPVPCPVCYVFSRWVGLGGLLGKMKRLQQQYGQMPTEEVAAKVKELEEEVKRRRQITEGDFASKDLAKVLGELSDKQTQLKDMLTLLHSGNVTMSTEQYYDLVDSIVAELGAERDQRLILGSRLSTGLQEALDTLESELDLYNEYAWLKKVRLHPEYKEKGEVPDDILFDINRGLDFAVDYPVAWGYRTTRGPALGKAAAPYSPLKVGQVITGIASDVETAREDAKNPFLALNATDKERKAIITKAIHKARVQNLRNGQRWQSTSDFRFEYVLDVLMGMLEMQAAGSKVQLYTKVPEAVPLFASMGAEVNCSLMPLGDGLRDGELVFSPITGMDGRDARMLFERFNNVQPIMVGISDAHIRACMREHWITFIIPYHASGGSQESYVSMMETVEEAVKDRTDYSDYQSDRVSDKPTEEQKSAREVRKAILSGAYLTQNPTKAEKETMRRVPFLETMYERFYAMTLDGKSLEKQKDYFHAFYSAGDATLGNMPIMPFEYWDYSSVYKETYEEGDIPASVNGRRFMDYCAALGVTPRFSGYNKDGVYNETKDFTNEDGYWKVLIDRSMYNRDGSYHVQRPIDITNVDTTYFTDKDGNMLPSQMSGEDAAKVLYESRTEGQGVVNPSKLNDPTKVGEITEKVLERIDEAERTRVPEMVEMSTFVRKVDERNRKASADLEAKVVKAEKKVDAAKEKVQLELSKMLDIDATIKSGTLSGRQLVSAEAKLAKAKAAVQAANAKYEDAVNNRDNLAEELAYNFGKDRTKVFDIRDGKAVLSEEMAAGLSGDTRLSVITPEMDADYLAAVEAGDMETAQRMVLEAAKLAMPNTKVVDENGNPLVVWRASRYGKTTDYTVFEKDKTGGRGFFFTNKQSAIERYGGENLRAFFLNITNPDVSNDFNVLQAEEKYTPDNDGVIFAPDGIEGINYEVKAFESSQIKSAEPVTYDDNGNVIPLSERFNPEKSDIRFSVLDTTKAELKDKPIKLNGMHRFKVKSAFKGVKGADGSFPYLKAEIIEVSDGYNGPAFTFDGTLQGFAVIYVPKGTISEGQKDNEFFIDPKAIESQLWDILKSAENYYEFKYAKGPYAHGGNWLNAGGNVLFSVSRGSLVGMHNISEEKLRKVIKQGGSANPSTAVIDIERQAFDSYGEISLIMPSSLVDAETGRNAGTFTADAWTPTYPQIEKRFSVDELQRAYWRDITAIPEEMQHEVRMAFDSWLDNRTASGLAYMFLQERGEAPEMVRVAAKFPQEIKDKMSAILGEGRTGFYELTDEEKQAVLDLYIQENFGGSREDFDRSIAETIQRIEDRLSTGKVPSFVEKRITADLQWMKEHGYNYDNLSDFVRDIVSDIRHAGEVNAAATTNRALDYIKDNNLSAEYEQWKESLNDRYGIKEYLFDGYTPSGNPRWLPNTVENASKLMNKQGLAGATGMTSSFNRFVATLAPKKKSLSDIRSSKERLVEDEKLVDDFRDKWSEVFFDLGIKCQPDAKGYEDYGLERLTEAAQKKNPGAYLKKEYGVELSQEDLQRLVDMIKAIKTEFPARYFETKFQRPVYLNEFAAAVIPTTTSADIKQAIAEAGLPIFEYDSSVDGARREATLKATDIEGVRFSIIGERGAMNDKTEEGLTRLANLDVARQMESQLNPDWSAKENENALKIKVATGWERGADGKWRYEVDDFMIKNENEWMDSKKKLTLRDIVEPHPVFDMYPDLLDIKIVKDRSKYNLGAYYDHKKNEMKLPFGALKDDADFARDFGYTPRESKSFMRTLQKMVMDILHEVQHAIQDREGFAPGGSSDMLMPEDRERYASLAKEYNALAEEYNAILDNEGYSKAAKEKLVQTERKEAEMKRFRQDHRIGGEGYKRLAGEVEAYNVETRHGLSDYERHNSLLSSTEDVAREDMIFIMNSIEEAENSLRFSVFEPHNATIDEIDGLFREYNMDESLVPLYDKVSALAHTMDLKIRFDYPWSAAAGSTFGDKVKFNTEFFNSLAYKSQDKAHALLHEMIHATTNYAIAARNTGALTEGMKEAVSQLEGIYGEIVNDSAFDGTYGARSVYEMVAELSNPEFRSLLKEKNLFQRIVDAIKRLLGIEVGENALDNLSATLDYMLDNYDGRVFGAVVNQYQKHQEYTRFSVVNENQAIFVSNAARAVEGIKMEKATPAQWLAMIEKSGGLKAGEDKWMGLSDWLKASDRKTLTKAEVLEFIGEHMIRIEEERYDLYAEEKAADVYDEIQRTLQSKFDAYKAEHYAEYDDYESDDALEYAMDKLHEEMEDSFPYTIEREYGSIYLTFPYEEVDDLKEWADKLGIEFDPELKPVNETRAVYTTDGLTNKKEIALVVPTIKPWNEYDDIHFGDAGNGRAVAWIRFGETTDEAGNNILVIDEIQSKRHQEGREQGYDNGSWDAAVNEVAAATSLEKKYIRENPSEVASYILLTIKTEEGKALAQKLLDANQSRTHLIPDAPFEKNWHELAMKRMLRYAAEEGYDFIAWTKGDQQAERYNIGKVISGIHKDQPTEKGYQRFEINSYTPSAPRFIFTDNEGKIVDAVDNDGEEIQDYVGKNLSEVFGKDLAIKMLGAEENTRISHDEMRVGGEGMKGFYDRMLPAFMNKYGKKWGIKVEDITLPNVEEAGRVMHSVPVTEEMKASVMEGQVMFSAVQIDPVVRQEMDTIKAKAMWDGTFMKAPNGADTNLTEEQWLMVRTNNFKNWFGDWINDPANASKIVDENGEPMVVYHGTKFGDFYEFKHGKETTNSIASIGYWFSPEERFGERFAAGDWRGTDEGRRTMHVFLNMRNPKVYESESDEQKDAALKSIEDTKTAAKEVFKKHRSMGGTIGLAFIGRVEEEYNTLFYGWKHGAENSDYFYNKLNAEDKAKVDSAVEDFIAAYNQFIEATRNYEDNYRYGDSYEKFKTDIYKEAGMSAEDANAAGIGMMIPNAEEVKTKYVEKLRSEGFDGIVIKQTRYDKGSAGGNNDQYVTFDSSQIKSATETTGLFSESGDIRFSAVTEAEEVEPRFSVVTDPALLDQLDNEEYITLYRAMQVVDGKLYPPMAGKVAFKEGEEASWGEPTPEQTWLQSDETPWNAVHARYDEDSKDGKHKKGDLKYDKNGDPVWVFKLDKGNGKTLYAAYNPYIHTSASPLNDQFSEAQSRSNLVVVRVLVPKSELTSGYKAEKAKDSVGMKPWHKGPISGVLAQYEGKGREVMLTRYAKINGIVDFSKVADETIRLFEGTGLLDHPLPTNVFMPGLREELEKRGVQFVETTNKGEIKEGAEKGKTWASIYGKDGLGKKPKTPRKAKKAKEDNTRFSAISTTTDNVVAEGMKFSIQDFARLAGNIFQDMPESFRKEAIEETFKRGWDMQSAIFQIPARLAEKQNWDEADKDLAKVIREKVQDAMDESGVVMSRPLTTKEALWMLYRSTEANSDSMMDAAKRSIVAHNLGFDSRSMALKEKADDYIRYSVVRNGQIDAATDMYNYEANLWTNRLKESWLDMNQSVIALQDALEKASGKPIASWENVVLALNQLSSKSYAEKKKYLRDFLMPLWDQIIEMTKVSGLSIEQIERYMMLKHGLERNKKFAMRDAKQFYREMYDKVADRMKNTSHAEQAVALSEANKRIADIDAQIATASGKKLKDLQEARERAVVEKEIAELVLRNDEQQNEADLQMYFNAIEAENNPKYAEFREKDYGGLTSMFMDQIADVKRSDYKTDEAYQAALLASVKPRFDKVADMEAEAQKEVDDYENKAHMPALWKLVNAATKETLRHQHAAGMITTEQYDAVRNMFDYYVPLRGFADNTAEDMYSYYMNNSAGGFAKPIIAAKGRKTRAESPLGWIGTMAESAIQQDNKNEVKMKLYYALMNRPDTGVLSLSEMWYEYDHTDPSTGRKVFVPAYPPATGGVLTADQMRQHMDAWEQSMKAKQAIGEAYKKEQGVNLGGSVIFQDKAQDAEHIIRVKVAGKDYAIIVNGNPRAAQAINGLLNPDANVGPVRQWYGALRRGLSALMTSFSPLFWVANYQRDLLSSFMRTSLNEGWGQAFKYLGNRFHGWKAAKYIYRYDNGKMGNSYYENLYKEFAENGGITGYTSLTTNKEYEKLLADYAENVDEEMLNWIKGVWDKFMGFGEAIEQVSRFAAYITARESGKSIEEAVAAAKEVSVNFNRKGSTSPISLDELEKLRDKNGKPLSMPKKAMAIAFSAMPSALKELYFFFNASIQALSSSAKLARKSPGKAMAWAGMYMGLSVGLAFLNYLLAGDDDDNDYLDLPDYLRHSTALFKMGDNYYFKWSLPQEMRPFYATADILVSKIMGKTPHKTAWATAGDVALATAEWLPVNPFGTEDPILALVPDAFAPLAEIRANQNSFGGRIYNDMSFKSEDVAKQIPAYRKGTSKTGEIYVDMAEFLNDITGGDEVQKGVINLNPAIVEHLVEGYGGGIYDFGKMVIGIPGLIYDAVWGEGVEVRDIPFVNKVLLSTDETNMNSHVNEAFYYYQGIADNAKRVENEYRKSDDPSRADDYMAEDDWRIYMLFRQYEEDLKMADEKVLDAVDDTEKELAFQEQNVIREMLLNDIARGVRPSTETIIKVAVESIRKESNDLLKPSREAERKLSEAKRRRNQQAEDAAKREFDSLRDLPEYKRGMSLKKDLDKIKRNLDKLQYMSPGTQRDSVLDKVQRDYDALLKKARVE